MKIFIDIVGCRLNQAEAERFAAQLIQKGHEITDNPGEADYIIINTCAVTAAAASDSRGKIRRAAHGGKAKIIVTGCWSAMEPQAAAQMERVISVVPNAQKNSLTDIIPDELTAMASSDGINGMNPTSIRIQLPGARSRTRAFVKAQDGCDNHCAFCLTRLARGRAKSVPLSQILETVHSVERSGGKEVVLTGVNLGAWGLDFNPPQTLRDLIELLLERSVIPRIRLSSLESWNLNQDFLTLWQNPRLCPHFHLPLQSGSASVLKRMIRRTTLEDFREIAATARSVRADFAITTDVIAGFPGETEAEFQQTLRFIDEIHFSGGHVFSFSSRPGTAAARMPDHLHGSLIHERSQILREEFRRLKLEFEQNAIGKTCEILWESADPLENGRFKLQGLTGNYLSVTAISPISLRNEISLVKLTKREDNAGLFGVIL